MDSLAGSLERFNRKERNLLVRAVLGHETKALELSGEFRKTVADALQIALIPPDAWWATDYHIAWLAGALAVYTEGADQAVAKRARPNPSVNGSSLVEGNQEDIDVVIASGFDLILIEAKGVGAWDNDQLRSKLARLELVRNEYMSFITKTPPASPLINFHFLIMSPHLPGNLEVEWPEWTRGKSSMPWIPFDISGDRLAVSRCDTSGTPAARSENWCIIKS